MKHMSIKEIAAACGGTYHGDKSRLGQEVSSVVIDSRKVEKDSLFIAIKGARVDGHTFIPQVMAAGALCAVAESDLGETDYPYIRVESCTAALKAIAEHYRRSLDIKVVGISGSVGKTSTKEMVASVLNQKYNVLKTAGNFNNEIGLPLTIFNIREEHEVAVLEMGISDFGEMTRLARIARPETCVITNIGTCHLENLGDRDGVLKAKTEIFGSLREGGNIVLNGDDDKLSTVKEYQGIRPVFFGLKGDCDVYADEIESKGLKGISCRIHLGEESFSVLVPMPGIHMVYNALAASAVGRIYHLTVEEIKRGIESLEAISGRFKMIETEKLLIVDDCYNANPMSMKASLDVLHDGAGRRVAILGDMGELGENEIRLHEDVGMHAASCGIDCCICVGELSRYMAEAAQKADPEFSVLYVKDRETLLENLGEYIEKGDTVLVKASHFMKFEEVVKALEAL